MKKILLGAALMLTTFSTTFAAHYEMTLPIMIDALANPYNQVAQQ